jgi:hypothetical protein
MKYFIFNTLSVLVLIGLFFFTSCQTNRQKITSIHYRCVDGREIVQYYNREYDLKQDFKGRYYFETKNEFIYVKKR